MATSENDPSDNEQPKSTDADIPQSHNPPDVNENSPPDDFSSVVEQVVNEPMQIAWQSDDENTNHPETPVKVLPPGPGIIESVGWMLGVFVAHFVGGIVFIICAFAYLISTKKLSGNPTEMNTQITQYFEEHLFEVASVEQGVFVLIVIAAVGLRLGKRTLSRLNLQSFATSKGFVLLLCVLPLAMISGELYRIAFDAWSVVTDQFPDLKIFDQMQTMEVVKQMAEMNPLWALVIVIAVLPAIGEELVFRGMIGRGLMARWGLVPAIIITSIMFGLVHVHPAHVVAVIPLGMFMHYVYYITRSFWAPVLVHFMNNAFAVTISKVALSEPELASKLGDETQAVHPLITLSASLFIMDVCWYFWKTRAKYINLDGSEWTPGYLSNESPPEGHQAKLKCESAPMPFYPSLAILFVMFFAMMQVFGTN